MLNKNSGKSEANYKQKRKIREIAFHARNIRILTCHRHITDIDSILRHLQPERDLSQVPEIPKIFEMHRERAEEVELHRNRLKVN